MKEYQTLIFCLEEIDGEVMDEMSNGWVPLGPPQVLPLSRSELEDEDHNHLQSMVVQALIREVRGIPNTAGQELEVLSAGFKAQIFESHRILIKDYSNFKECREEVSRRFHKALDDFYGNKI